MIKEVIELLQARDFYGVDPVIDIAKGKYKAPVNIKELKESVKRRSNG
tara:strand:+ start:2199 stop:2342 length:144 start_codon:yes stop_codon:yes gene_type:complete